MVALWLPTCMEWFWVACCPCQPIHRQVSTALTFDGFFCMSVKSQFLVALGPFIITALKMLMECCLIGIFPIPSFFSFSALKVNQLDIFQVFLAQSLTLSVNYTFKYWSLHQTHIYWIHNQRLLFEYLWIWILLQKMAEFTFIVLRKFTDMLNTICIWVQFLQLYLLTWDFIQMGKKTVNRSLYKIKVLFLWCSILCWWHCNE